MEAVQENTPVQNVMPSTSTEVFMMNPTEFVSDLSAFRPEKVVKFDDYQKQYEFDISGINNMIQDRPFLTKRMSQQPYCETICSGFSNNHVTGASLDDLEWQISGSNIVQAGWNDMTAHLFGSSVLNAELTKDIVEKNEELGVAAATDWHCKGCEKYFATKGSLKRHHDRKQSCKEISEKKFAELINNDLSITEWVEKLLQSSISGTSELPYCKHCDVEFANKSNLTKHLSKSTACNKLAKHEFVEAIQNDLSEKQKEKKIPGPDPRSPWGISSRLASNLAMTNSINV